MVFIFLRSSSCIRMSNKAWWGFSRHRWSIRARFLTRSFCNWLILRFSSSVPSPCLFRVSCFICLFHLSKRDRSRLFRTRLAMLCLVRGFCNKCARSIDSLTSVARSCLGRSSVNKAGIQANQLRWVLDFHNVATRYTRGVDFPQGARTHVFFSRMHTFCKNSSPTSRIAPRLAHLLAFFHAVVAFFISSQNAAHRGNGGGRAGPSRDLIPLPSCRFTIRGAIRIIAKDRSCIRSAPK